MKRTVTYGVLIAAIGIGAFLVRCHRLSRRPMHHDEANQAVRCGRLLETGEYKYDPDEHHGPSLYFLTLPIAWLTSGKSFAATSEWTFRLLPVLAGIGTLLLLPLVRDGTGTRGSLAAALLLAVSPAILFYNRFYIQESLLVFFTFGAIAAGWRYAQTRKAAWAVTAGICLGLMHATKETCVIAYAGMGAGLLAAAYRPLAAGLRDERTFRRHIALGVAAAVFVSVILFSSFFTHWKGPVDSIRTYFVYFGRAGGENTDHVHPWNFYLKQLFWSPAAGKLLWSEGAVLLLALVGGARAFTREGGSVNRAFIRFLVVYTVLTTVAYSAIPYKTPWCMLSFYLGMVLLAGVGAGVVLLASRRLPIFLVSVALLLGAAVHLGRQAHRTLFVFDADTRNPHVYAHTSRDYLKLVRRLDEIAAVSPDARKMLVYSVTNARDMWPLPWYARTFEHVGYWTDADDPAIDYARDGGAAVLIVSPELEEAVRNRLGSDYLVEYYGLRNEVLLSLFIRRDLWDAFIATRSK
jgi:uncharacterized protein (TIGR03663 family)